MSVDLNPRYQINSAFRPPPSCGRGQLNPHFCYTAAVLPPATEQEDGGIFQQLVSEGTGFFDGAALVQFAGHFSQYQDVCHSAETKKPLSMCFHVSRAHCEFSPWPHFYYGH